MELVKETRNVDFINYVINHPDVLPDVALGHKGHLDATRLLENPRNRFFATDMGGFLVLDQGDGVYDVHTQFLKGGRGKAARLAAKEAMEWMFLNTDCMELSTFCPDENKKAINLALFSGMSKRESLGVVGIMGHRYSITIKEWLCPQPYR